MEKKLEKNEKEKKMRKGSYLRQVTGWGSILNS
jgi:hypothetical protein